VLWHGSSVTYLCGGGEHVVFGDACHELGEVVAGELPLEGLGGGLVAAFEVEESLFDVGEVGEVVWG
jgi:hypothetical protein